MKFTLGTSSVRLKRLPNCFLFSGVEISLDPSLCFLVFTWFGKNTLVQRLKFSLVGNIGASFHEQWKNSWPLFKGHESFTCKTLLYDWSIKSLDYIDAGREVSNPNTVYFWDSSYPLTNSNKLDFSFTTLEGSVTSPACYPRFLHDLSYSHRYYHLLSIRWRFGTCG